MFEGGAWLEYVRRNEEWMLMVAGDTSQVGETKNDYKKQIEKEREFFREEAAWEVHEGCF